MKLNDLTGQKFGRLTVVGLAGRNPVRWQCLCDCGQCKVVRVDSLRSDTKGCGCVKGGPPATDFSGKVFGSVTVIRKFNRAPVTWLCRCVCGVERTYSSTRLTSGDIRSCGCHRRTARLPGGSRCPEYWSWVNLIRRCENVDEPSYRNYGGRGIRVCSRWRTSFRNFFADVGERPTPNHTIDRIDNNGDYEPSNCRWATPIEQARNRRGNVLVELSGQTMTISEALEVLGMGIKHRYRLRYKMGMGRDFQQSIREVALGI